MRLHTDFHDYYDYAVGYGIDENVHYNRFSKEVKIHISLGLLDLMVSQNNGMLNPKLKDYDFERIKDVFTIFQEISMYLSNILVEQKETVFFDDKFKIEQH